MKIFIVIAAYNEAESIGNVIRDLKKGHHTNIVVVDDGSKDNTSSIAKKAKAIVLKHSLNRGQGAALRTGIDYSVKKGADVVVTFDADGQHRVEDIPSMIRPVLNNEVDVTLGSRFLRKDSKVPLMRKIVLKGGIFLIRLFYGVKLTDVHN